jgi:tight adherence protein C
MCHVAHVDFRIQFVVEAADSPRYIHLASTGNWLMFWWICLWSAVGLLLLPILKRRQRKNRIRLGLQDAVDLIIICIEAGLSPDKALTRTSKDLRDVYPDLSDELFFVTREMRYGCSWEEALYSFSERTRVVDVKALADAPVQAGPLGIVRALRAYSDSLRIARRPRARAEDLKAAIKLVAAAIFLVVPSVAIVTLGPP